MKSISRFFLAVVFMLFISVPVSPRTLQVSSFFSPGEIASVKKNIILTYAKIEGKGEAVATGIEVPFPQGTVFLDEPPEHYSVVAVEKAFFKADPDEAGRIFNVLTDYPALKGMKYFSISEGKPLTLIPESYMTGNTRESGNVVSRKTFSSFTIRDNRLGIIPFRSDAVMENGVITVASICSGSVSRFGLKVFEPGDYRVYKFMVYDKRSGGWFYCSVQLMMVRSDIMKRLDLLKAENICNRLRGETVHILGLLGFDRSSQLAAFR